MTLSVIALAMPDSGAQVANGNSALPETKRCGHSKSTEDIPSKQRRRIPACRCPIRRSFSKSISDTEVRGVTLRGSIVGTRLDLAEALAFAAAGKVHTTVTERSLHEVNQVFDEMRNSAVNGR